MSYTDAVARWVIADRRLDFVSVVPLTHGWHDNQTWPITKYMTETRALRRSFSKIIRVGLPLSPG